MWADNSSPTLVERAPTVKSDIRMLSAATNVRIKQRLTNCSSIERSYSTYTTSTTVPEFGNAKEMAEIITGILKKIKYTVCRKWIIFIFIVVFICGTFFQCTGNKSYSSVDNRVVTFWFHIEVWSLRCSVSSHTPLQIFRWFGPVHYASKGMLGEWRGLIKWNWKLKLKQKT